MLASPAGAGGLVLSGNVRARYEALGGQGRVGLKATEDAFSFRTILTAEYAKGPITFGAELQDSRVYGGEAGGATGANDVNVLEPVQAWIAADFPEIFRKGSKARVQAGRFILNLGSRRLVAADEYRNTTNGYTGLRGDIRLADGTTGTFIYTLPQIRLPDAQRDVLDNKVRLDRESGDLRLWGGLAARPLPGGRTMAEIGYFRLRERDAPARATRNRDLHTISVRLIREPSPRTIDYEVEGIAQFGDVRASNAATAARLEVAAWFVHAELGHAFGDRWKTRLSAEYDRASGDKPGGRFGRFDTLFGMRRADFAPAGIYAQIGRANISSPGVRLETVPSARLDGFMTYRALWAAEARDAFSSTEVRDPGGRAGSFAGHQVDGRVRYWLIDKRLRGEVNAAWLIKGGLLRDAPNAPKTGNTRYISLAMTTLF